MTAELRLAVLGDSLAAGTGAARAADGLGPRLAAALTAGGVPVVAHVVAVPGAVSPGLDPQVVRALAAGPDVALVVVGGNDLIRGVAAADSVAHLRRAVVDLRGAGADVVVVPVPDLSVVAHVPAGLRDLVRTASSALRAAQSSAVLAAGGRVVDPSPATTARFGADAGLFSADRFHPSSAGYAVLAADLLPVLQELVTARRDAREAGGGD
ncbi:GDSL-type esterase/lipase family protein [Kineococcus rubinsiae]|uniref:GDSL-type esterase/lipase family protein n=1 Tax=Kineococcus rubinsiae TaxID=2609562 RepID=UPI00142FCC9A|nr:GDSL-type esterase/lipase family protein [Kineococcus rubinsiae]NIZ89539.1 SGNH/GDSL hydrolase family protein [Kineococcus rubinsiae]